jgi:hypothetical protein
MWIVDLFTLSKQLSTLNGKVNQMALSLDGLKKAVADQKVAVDAALARISEDVKHLQDLLAAGEAITQADLDGIQASIEAETAVLKSVDPLPDFPPAA